MRMRIQGLLLAASISCLAGVAFGALRGDWESEVPMANPQLLDTLA